MTLLDTINSREALCALNDAQLRQLCDEIRQFLVLNVARTGGHLASNLGVVELSVALERVFDTSRDRLLFDVGHQSYVHKILTGRRDECRSLRMVGGLAKQGMIPVVAIYSTFLQRAYDMLLQDVAMLGLHVVFAVDRAGLVGGDGETHHGVFDVNYLRSVPGMQVLCPASQAELGQMLRRAVLEMTGPVAVRYPRGCDGTFTGIAEQPCLREGSDITLVTYGTLVNEVLAAAKMLQARGISAEVRKLPSIKPLDVRTVAASMRKTGRLLVAEESVCIGCVGKELLASLRARGVGGPVRLCNLGDRFIPHGAVPELYRLAGLDAKSLADAAWEVCQNEA